MKRNNRGTIRGYFRPSEGTYDLQSGISALIEAGVCSGNLFFDQEGHAELERLIAQTEAGDTVIVLRLDDICTNIDELFRTVRRLLLRGVGLQSLGEPWFRLTGETMQGPALYELIARLHDLSVHLQSRTSRAEPVVRRPVGRPKCIRAEYRKKLDAALQLYTERRELSVAEICGKVGLNERTFYRYLDQQGFRVVRRPKGRKTKTNARAD